MSWAAAAAAAARRGGQSVEECGDWRGEGWVHWDSRGERGGGREGNVPRGKRIPYSLSLTPHGPMPNAYQ